METLGPLVRKARTRKGIRAADLAYRIGKDPSYLSKLERDLLKEIPEPSVLIAIEEHLGLPQERMLRALGYVITPSMPSTVPLAPGREAVIAIVDDMDEEERLALVNALNILLGLRQSYAVSEPNHERVPALR